MSDELIESTIRTIFGEKMTPSGKGKAAYVKNWILNRIADANGDKYPRDIVDLLNNAKNIEKELLEKNKDHKNKIISHKALLDALPKVSQRRLKEFEEDEYAHLKNVFEAFRGKKSPMSFEDLEIILVRKAKIKEKDIENYVKILKEAGFLKEESRIDRKERTIKRIFRIPHIFAKALDIAIHGY